MHRPPCTVSHNSWQERIPGSSPCAGAPSSGRALSHSFFSLSVSGLPSGSPLIRSPRPRRPVHVPRPPAHAGRPAPPLPLSSTTTTTTSTAAVPVVLSCASGSKPSVRPTGLTVGCATGGTTVTAITWNAWDAAGGGQGTGVLNVNSCTPDCGHGTVSSASAIVVVFHAVNGVFQDVSITPTKDVSLTPKTTTSTTAGIPPATVPPTTPTTSQTTGGPAPVFASQPGSGWGWS